MITRAVLGGVLRRTVAMSVACAVTLTVAAGPAAAAPTSGQGAGQGGAAAGSAPRVDNTRWPAALNWVIPGTAEFTARYTAGDTAGGVPVIADTGCTAEFGGDAWRYTVDFFTNLGAILDAQATATGQPVMALGDQPLPTAPWPGLATDRGIPVLTSGSGEKVAATPGALIPMPQSGGALANGVGVCADTLRAYGTPSTDAPFGFGFYTAPDQGSVDFLMAQLGKQSPPASGAGGDVWADPAQFYDPVNGAGNPLRGWEFSPLRVTDYCADSNNPFCLTAAFLRCPTGQGATKAQAAAILACRTWNADVIILNQDIAMTLLAPGVGVPQGGDLDFLDAVASPGRQAPLDGWTALAADGASLTKAVKMMYVVLGGGLLVGGLLAGGIPGLLIAAGVIGAAALVAGQGIFGAVTCAQDFPRCAAAAGADGLVKTLALIPDAARSARVPDMTGGSMTRLLNTLGGISAATVLVFFLISLLAAAVMRRPAQIWPAFFGLIGWGAAMGLGGAFLTMLVAARTGLMTWLDTDGGGGTVLDGFPASVKESLNAIAADPSPGLLLAALLSLFGMLLGAVVWVIVWVSGQWIPLVVALLVLQSAGLAAPGMPRKWLSRGFSVLWTLLLTPVLVMIIWRVGRIGLDSNTGYLGLLTGVLILLACAFSFLIVQRMLPIGEGGSLGVGAAMLSAGSWVAGRASSAGRPGPSREQMAQRQMERAADGAADPDPDGSGAGGGAGGAPVPPTLPGTAAADAPPAGPGGGDPGSRRPASPSGGAPGGGAAGGGAATGSDTDAPERLGAGAPGISPAGPPGPDDAPDGAGGAAVTDGSHTPGAAARRRGGGVAGDRATGAGRGPGTAARVAAVVDLDGAGGGPPAGYQPPPAATGPPAVDVPAPEPEPVGSALPEGLR